MAGWDPPVLWYRYDAQPGTYAIARMLHSSLGWDTLASLSLLGAMAAASFALFAAALVHRITRLSYPAAGLVVLSFQEVATAAYYVNSNVFAGGFAIPALYLATRAEESRSPWAITLWVGLLLGLAGWMRSDVALIAPTCLFLFHRSSWRNAAIHTALAGICALMVFQILFHWSGGRLSNLIGFTQGHMVFESVGTPNLGIPWLGSTDIKSHIAFFSALNLLWIFWGVARLICSGSWRILAFCLAGFLPLYGIYFGHLTTPKYLYYTVPFLACLAGTGILAIWNASRPWRRAGVALSLLLLVGQYGLGLRVSFRSKPWVKDPPLVLVRIFSTGERGGRISKASLVLGSGSIVNTDDEHRLPSGSLFFPSAWRYQKTLQNRSFGKLEDYLETLPSERISLITGASRGWRILMYLLLKNGYTCIDAEENHLPFPEPPLYRSNWHRHDRIVELVYRDCGGRTWEDLNAALSMDLRGHKIYVVDRGWEETMFMEHAEPARKICGFTDIYMLAAYDLMESPVVETQEILLERQVDR